MGADSSTEPAAGTSAELTGKLWGSVSEADAVDLQEGAAVETTMKALKRSKRITSTIEAHPNRLE